MKASRIPCGEPSVPRPEISSFAPSAPPPHGASLRASLARVPIWDRFRDQEPSRSFATFQAVFWPPDPRWFRTMLAGTGPRRKRPDDTRQDRGATRPIARPAGANRPLTARLPGRRRARPPDGRRREQPRARRRRSPDRPQARRRRRRARARGSWSRTSGASVAISARRDIGRVRHDEIERARERRAEVAGDERGALARARAAPHCARATSSASDVDVGADAVRVRQFATAARAGSRPSRCRDRRCAAAACAVRRDRQRERELRRRSRSRAAAPARRA